MVPLYLSQLLIYKCNFCFHLDVIAVKRIGRCFRCRFGWAPKYIVPKSSFNFGRITEVFTNNPVRLVIPIRRKSDGHALKSDGAVQMFENFKFHNKRT